MPKDYYISTSNGDYNSNTVDLTSVEWELNEGCQKYVLVTKKPITSKQYQRIAKILSEKGK